MKKRWMVFPAALLLITGLILAGCPNGDDTTTTANTTELKAKIAEAEGEKNTTPVDTDGSHTASGRKWVTQEVMTTFTSAIAAAKTALTGASQTKVDAAVVTLDNAITTFRGAKSDGTQQSGFTLEQNIVLVAEATEAKKNVSVSADGSDISPTVYWVTQNVLDDLNNAIAAADTIKGGTLSDANYLALSRALTAFTAAKRLGTNNPSDTGNKYTVTVNGTLHKVTTEFITLTFERSVPRDGLGLSDITFTSGTGAITAIFMTNANGPTRTITVGDVASEGDIRIKINKEGISATERIVTVYKKLGLQPDNTVTIADVVKVGAVPSLPSPTAITFARNDGDPIAILPPVTKDPISSMSATAPGLVQDFVVFNTPLDLTTTATRDFRWFEMVWDNFGSTYEIDGTTYVVHQVGFWLDLTTENDENIRFQKVSESNTTTGEKTPVQFLKSNIQTGTGLTAWGAGHRIKAAKLTIYSIQFRDSGNSAWPTLGSSAVPSAAFDDLWVRSLTVDAFLPPAPKVLYSSATNWSAEVNNPKWAIGDDIDLSPSNSGYADKVHDATVGTLQFFGENDKQKVFRWDAFDITVPASAGTAQYTRLLITFTGTAVGWYGYGSISENADGDIIKQMLWNGANTSTTGGAFVVPLTAPGYTPNQFYPQKFRGFFIQWNGNGTNNSVTITEIRLEG